MYSPRNYFCWREVMALLDLKNSMCTSVRNENKVAFRCLCVTSAVCFVPGWSWKAENWSCGRWELGPEWHYKQSCVRISIQFLFSRYFLYLHFKCYPESFLYPPPALLSYLPTPTSWLWCSILEHIKFAIPRGLSSQWWLTRPSSATYAARGMSSGVTG
jgi:cellulose synthase/poly-beta-1,6-N-acetylglucosamine synthase-like glycosyltransferase